MSESKFEITVGTLLLCGIVFSFIPQYHRIIKKRSSEGLSAWYLFIGTAGTYASLSNALIFYWEDLRDFDKSTTDWYLDTLGFWQMLALWIAFYSLFLMFTWFLQKEPSTYRIFNDADEVENGIVNLGKEQFNNYAYCMRLFKTSVIWIIVLSAINIGLLTHESDSKYNEGYAQALGAISIITGLFQYIPQIKKTYGNWNIGSLSIHSLFIQVPGSYLWVYFLISQSAADYSTWIPFLSAAVLQTILLGLCLWIKRSGKDYLDYWNQSIDL